jgi:chromosome segregation ATPase
MSIFKKYKDEFDKSFAEIKSLTELTKEDVSNLQMENINNKTQIHQFKKKVKDYDSKLGKLELENKEMHISINKIDKDTRKTTDDLLALIKKQNEEINNLKILILKSNEKNETGFTNLNQKNKYLEDSLKELRFWLKLLILLIIFLAIFYVIISFI